MKKGEWTFITNHGKLLAYLTKHPTATAQEIAFNIGLSIRAVSKIVNDLRNDGYITWHKESRHNHYTIHLDRPMQRNLEKGHKVGGLLAAIGCNESEAIWRGVLDK